MPPRTLIAAAVFVCAAAAAPATQSVPFDFGRTMRIDYVHGGGPGGEFVTLDGVFDDGAWPGSWQHLIDDTNLGEYLVEVADAVSSRALYSRGFGSIYGEWKTTPEARSADRRFHESVRIPWPTRPVRVFIRARDRDNVFRDLWSTDIDPAAIRRMRTATRGVRLSSMFVNGPARSKVDLLIVSEGYAASELPQFRAQAKRLIEALFALEPFKSRRSDFNVRLLEVSAGPLPVEFNVFGIERYALTFNNRVLRDRTARAPYDVIEILVNDRRYGGGGIFNLQSTVAAASRQAEHVFIHEFAHNFAGLADEYVGEVTYETGTHHTTEPWEPNITALGDPAALKWRDLIEPGTPIPTPVSYAGKVGAFEGGRYEAQGLFRGELDCIMGAYKPVGFCRVCQRAINRIIDLNTK